MDERKRRCAWAVAGGTSASAAPSDNGVVTDGGGG